MTYAIEFHMFSKDPASKKNKGEQVLKHNKLKISIVES